MTVNENVVLDGAAPVILTAVDNAGTYKGTVLSGGVTDDLSITFLGTSTPLSLITLCRVDPANNKIIYRYGARSSVAEQNGVWSINTVNGANEPALTPGETVYIAAIVVDKNAQQISEISNIYVLNITDENQDIPNKSDGYLHYDYAPSEFSKWTNDLNATVENISGNVFFNQPLPNGLLFDIDNKNYLANYDGSGIISGDISFTLPYEVPITVFSGVYGEGGYTIDCYDVNGNIIPVSDVVIEQFKNDYGYDQFRCTSTGSLIKSATMRNFLFVGGMHWYIS